MRIAIYPYKMGSKSARNLRDCFNELGHRAKLVRERGRYRPKPSHLILGWGNPRVPIWGATDLNHPLSIGRAINKQTAYAHFIANNVPTLEVTVDHDKAKGWLAEGKRVVGRQVLDGARGRGIVLMSRPEEFVECPLYTKFKKSDREYRVHVVGGEVIDYLQKKRPNGAGELVPIRSATNGWVYCRTDILPLPDQAAEAAVKAVAALGLDFGGVDILWGNKTGAKVLEVNTAPGIEGEGVRKFAIGILDNYGEQI